MININISTNKNGYINITDLIEIHSSDPTSVPLKNLNKYVVQTHRTITCENKQGRYIKHQKLIDGKWVLHNLNGPAVIHLKSKKECFFIDGIEYQDELQYLVAKEAYTQ